MSAPGIARTKRSPALEPHFVGVRLALGGADGEGLPRVHGAFRLPIDEAAAIDPRLHRAIVLVVAQWGRCEAVTPFHDVVLCEDDQETHETVVEGYFDVDVAAALHDPIPGQAFVTASLGPYVTEVIELELEPQRSEP